MAEPEKEESEGQTRRRRWVDDFALEGPWTEADEVWLEYMTGDYERRLQREIYAREAAEADL